MAAAKVARVNALLARVTKGRAGFPLRPDVQQIELTAASNGAGASGVRHFVREDLPSLKYANADRGLQVVLRRDPGAASSMTVVRQGGAPQTFDLKGKRADEIVSLLRSNFAA